jgi:hypothetical protein
MELRNERSAMTATRLISPRVSRRLSAAIAVAALVVCSGGGHAQAPAPAAASSFAAHVAALSEAEGYFDTDNLISNEQSYLSVLSDVDRAALRGGAYVGVGPDQNFTYIAAAQPSVAFIIDVRRDNLLLHLLFKALFALSRTRVEYLALLCGRAVPEDLEPWRTKNIAGLAAYVDGAPPLDRRGIDALRVRVTAKIRSFGVPLSENDLSTVDRFHRRFIESSLGLRFETFGRAPQAYYPTLRQLLLEVDSSGRQRNYLASEEPFQFLKALQARDMVIPLVGNLSGATAMVAIGRWLREHNERLSLFYASNVESYLFREGNYARFVDNLSHIPHGDRALIIRSVFGGGGSSVSQTQVVPELLDGYSRGRFHSYWELVR